MYWGGARTSGSLTNGRVPSRDPFAPPTLQFLAKIEQERIETGLFPITLSSGGMTTTGEQKPSSEAFERADMAAARHINQAALPADDARLTIEALSTPQKIGVGIDQQSAQRPVPAAATALAGRPQYRSAQWPVRESGSDIRCPDGCRRPIDGALRTPDRIVDRRFQPDFIRNVGIGTHLACKTTSPISGGTILPPPRSADLLDLEAANEQIAPSSRVSIGDSQKYSGSIPIGPTIFTRTETLP